MQYSFLVRKRAANNYQLVISYKGKDGKWHQKAKGGYTKARLASSDVEISKLLETIKHQIAVTPGNENLMFKDFLAMYAKDKKLRIGTTLGYNSTVVSVPSLLKYPMCQITTAMIKKELALSDISLSTKNVRITQLKSVFKAAHEEYEVIPENPMSKVKYYKDDSKGLKRETLTSDEIERLLLDGCVARHRYDLVVAIGAFAGLRISETLGLTVADIDFEQCAIHVKYQYYTRKHSKAPLKTKNSNRTVPMPPRLSEMLSTYIYEISSPQDSDRLFSGINKNSFNEWMKNVTNKTSHCLRHTYITNLIANGVDVKTAAALAGDTAQTILNSYVHYTDKMREKASKDVARIFG